LSETVFGTSAGNMAAYALATSVFVGIHPVFTHVPPNLWRSIIATAIPVAENRAAKDGLA